jgi:transcriptional regulator with XRE-family HTH domain
MLNLNVYVGKNIRNIREKRNISQEYLAFAAGIDRSYMGRVERGLVSITLSKLYDISQALECDIRDLLPVHKIRKKPIKIRK